MVQIHHPQCPFCHTPVTPSDSKVACDRCMGWQHAPCWDEHGSCATCRGTIRLARTNSPAPVVTERIPLRLDPPDPELEAYIRAQIAGVPEPESNPTQALPWDCPRCRLPLTPSRYEDTHVQSCRECFGYWASELACSEIAIKRDAYFSAEERRTVLQWALEDYSGQRNPELPCPMCLAHLTPTPFMGLLLYRCHGHGVWLDTGDIKRVQIVVESSRTLLNDLLRTLRS
jgi:Zn-finger nucleic acid-binding protein